MTIKEKLKFHCYLCQHYFTFDEIKDKRIEVKILLSNLTYGKIPICTSCKWDKDKAEKRMKELWKDEMTISSMKPENKKIALSSIKKLKIVKKVA